MTSKSGFLDSARTRMTLKGLDDGVYLDEGV